MQRWIRRNDPNDRAGDANQEAAYQDASQGKEKESRESRWQPQAETPMIGDMIGANNAARINRA